VTVKHVLRAVAAAGLAACHAPPRAGVSPANRVLGTFVYEATIGQRQDQGRFTIAADTVTVEPRSATCLPGVEPQVREYIHVFDCAGAPGVRSLRLIIDSREPIRSTWSAVVTETTMNKVCDQYATGSSGQQMCVRYRNETDEKDKRTGGRLYVVAAPPI
jgi:hypothetical protein